MNPENNENGNREGAHPRRNLFLTVFAVVFISAWTFFLGVMVGRDMAPVKFDIEKMQRQIEELKRESLAREREIALGAKDQGERQETEVRFYDVLREEEEADPLDSVFPEPKEKDPVERTTENAEPSRKKPLPAVFPEDAVSAPEKKPEEKSPDEPLKNYSIQVASSKDPKEADKLVEKFKKKGYPAYRTSVDIRDAGVWHRIRIGPFKAYSEAQRILNDVKKERSSALILEH